MRLHASTAAAGALLLALVAAPGGVAAAQGKAKPTLEDCKAALVSLNTPPQSTSLPFMAASTGKQRMDVLV